MATSGTSTFTLDVDDVLLEAFERVGVTQPSGGDLRSGRRSLNLLLQELANRGELLWATGTETIVLGTGVSSYTLPADTLTVTDLTVRRTGTTDTQITMTPLGITEFRQLPSSSTSGRPLSFVLNRDRDAPTLSFWPAPDASYDITVERRRRIQDVSTYTENLDLPMRYLPAIIAGLAWALADKRPGSVDANRRGELLARYETELDRALVEDRERVSLFLSIDLEPR
jgi:hypothetical protein